MNQHAAALVNRLGDTESIRPWHDSWVPSVPSVPSVRNAPGNTTWQPLRCEKRLWKAWRKPSASRCAHGQTPNGVLSGDDRCFTARTGVGERWEVTATTWGCGSDWKPGRRTGSPCPTFVDHQLLPQRPTVWQVGEGTLPRFGPLWDPPGAPNGSLKFAGWGAKGSVGPNLT